MAGLKSVQLGHIEPITLTPKMAVEPRIHLLFFCLLFSILTTNTTTTSYYYYYY